MAIGTLQRHLTVRLALTVCQGLILSLAQVYVQWDFSARQRQSFLYQLPQGLILVTLEQPTSLCASQVDFNLSSSKTNVICALRAINATTVELLCPQFAQSALIDQSLKPIFVFSVLKELFHMSVVCRTIWVAWSAPLVGHVEKKAFEM